jgi:hypothetical protein
MTDPIPTVSRRRTPLWLWVMLTLLALSVLITSSVFHWLVTLDHLPAQVVIDGKDVIAIDPDWFSGWNGVGIFASGVVCVFAVLLVIPVILLIALAGTLIGTVLGVVLPLIVVTIVLAVVLSPLWILGLVLWRVLRRAPRGMVVA